MGKIGEGTVEKSKAFCTKAARLSLKSNTDTATKDTINKWNYSYKAREGPLLQSGVDPSRGRQREKGKNTTRKTTQHIH